MIDWTTLPAGWEIAAYRAADYPDDLWLSVKAPGMGELSMRCTKPNERRMALALMKHSRGVAPARAPEQKGGA